MESSKVGNGSSSVEKLEALNRMIGQPATPSKLADVSGTGVAAITAPLSSTAKAVVDVVNKEITKVNSNNAEGNGDSKELGTKLSTDVSSGTDSDEDKEPAKADGEEDKGSPSPPPTNSVKKENEREGSSKPGADTAKPAVKLPPLQKILTEEVLDDGVEDSDDDEQSTKPTSESDIKITAKKDSETATKKVIETATKIATEATTKQEEAAEEVPKMAEEGREFVHMKGIWNGGEWSGEWFTSQLPSVCAPFEYTPKDDIDDEMEDLPCKICTGIDPDEFLFCDLCNEGFHARCCNSVLPKDDEDWHCNDCNKILGEYGSLPPSRDWKGWFRMKEGSKLTGKVTETFELKFRYLYETTSKQSGKSKIASISGTGFNKFGGFKAAGELWWRIDKIEMELRKVYLEGEEALALEKRLKKKQMSKRTSRQSHKDDTGATVPGKLRPKISIPPVSAESIKRKLTHSSEDQSEEEGRSATNTPANKKPKRQAEQEDEEEDDEEEDEEDSEEERRKRQQRQKRKRKSRRRGGGADSVLVADLRKRIALLQRQLEKERDHKRLLVFSDMDSYFHSSSVNASKNRIALLWALLSTSSQYQGKLTWLTDIPRARLDVVFDTHDMAYVNELFELAAENQENHLNLTTALKNGGSVCKAIDCVIEKHMNAVCLVRPPGHRTGRNGPIVDDRFKPEESECCVLNTVAIGAIYCLKVTPMEKAAVIDFSIVGGSGTEQVLSEYLAAPRNVVNPIFYGSVCISKTTKVRDGSASPPLMIPGSPAPAAASNPNFVKKIMYLQEQVDSEEWRKQFRTVFEDLKTFSPTVILVSAGFDGEVTEESTGDFAKLTADDYKWVTKKLVGICPRVISVLEGGNGLVKLQNNYQAHCDALLRL